MKVYIVLQCEHARIFRYAPPRNGQSIYCHECADMRKVIGGSGDWRAVCDQCLYKQTRKSNEALGRTVRDHLRSRPHHSITVWRIGEQQSYTVRWCEASNGAPVLTLFDSPDTLH